MWNFHKTIKKKPKCYTAQRESDLKKITDVVFTKIKMRSVEAQKDDAELSYEEERALFFKITNIRKQN